MKALARCRSIVGSNGLSLNWTVWGNVAARLFRANLSRENLLSNLDQGIQPIDYYDWSEDPKNDYNQPNDNGKKVGERSNQFQEVHSQTSLRLPLSRTSPKWLASTPKGSVLEL
jgi:hypothetical protein